MASKIEIYNMALFHAGSTSKVASVDEQSMEQIVCTTFYATALDSLLSYKSADWGFATKSVVLAGIGSPPTNWLYRYAYPNDCVRSICIVIPGTRNPMQGQEIAYDIQQSDVSQSIVTDMPEAELLYISRGLPAERLPSPVVLALSYWLAALICTPLKKDMATSQALFQMAEQWTQVAMAASLNQQQPDNPPISIYEAEAHA
mgnify:CR=1 FL=1